MGSNIRNIIVDCLKLLLKERKKSFNTLVSLALIILKAQSYAAVVEAPMVKIGILAKSQKNDNRKMSPILEINLKMGLSMLKIFKNGSSFH